METRDPERILQTLQEDLRPNWIVVGEALTALEATGRASDRDGVPWVRRILCELASSNRSVGSGQIHKMVRVYKLLMDVSKYDRRLDPGNMHHVSMGALEIAQRIYSLDEGAGRQAVEHVRIGASISQINEIYKKVRRQFSSKIDIRKMAIAEHDSSVAQAIDFLRCSEHLFCLDKGYQLIKTRGHHTKYYVSFDFKVSCIDSKTIGFEVIILDPRIWARHRSRTLFAATFFDEYWIFMVIEQRVVKKIVEEFRELKVRNVGVIGMFLDADPQIISRPDGYPEPDRRDLLQKRPTF